MSPTLVEEQLWQVIYPLSVFIHRDMTEQKSKNRNFPLWKSLKYDHFLNLKKKYLLPAVSCIPINLPVCSTHEYYKLVNFQAQGSFHLRDNFFSKLKICSLWASLKTLKWMYRARGQIEAEIFFWCPWWLKSTTRLLKNRLEASYWSRRRVFTFKWLVEDKEILWT